MDKIIMAVDINEPVDKAGPSQTEALIDAFKSGEAKLGGTQSVEAEEPEADTEPLESPTDVLDAIQGTAPEETESEQDSDLSEATESETSQDEPELGDIEELVVTGANGRRKVKVDFSDRDKLKKHVQLAYGARKWQKERDDARSNLKAVQEELVSFKEDWGKIEKAYESNGVRGLVDLLEGREGAYQDFLKQELEIQNMSTDERAQYDAEQERLAQERQNQKLREEYEAKLAEIKQSQEKAEMRSLESKLHPSFDRYRFSGRLGDEVAETEFDEMLWNRALSNLEKIADEDVELTQAMIDKEFRRVSTAIKKHLNTQVESRVKKSINKKKVDATKKVQAQVSKGMKDSAEAIAFRDNMKSGDIVSGLTSFFKAGGKIR